MDIGHAEATNRVALEVELDQHHRLAADNPLPERQRYTSVLASSKPWLE